MSESAVALAFGPLKTHDVYRVFGTGESIEKSEGRAEVMKFTSAEECRIRLKGAPAVISVIVDNRSADMAGINLAAALAGDIRERDVYLLEENPSQTLLCNARVSGVRGVIDSSQAELLLASRLERSELKRILSTTPIPPKRAEQAKKTPTVSDSPVLLPLPSASSVPPEATGESFFPEIQIIGQSDEAGTGRVVGFFSGRGGVGKSAVSLMTALAARKRGLKVAIIDLDLQFGDIGFLVGREPSGHFERMELSQVCACDRMPAFADDALVVISAPDLPEKGESYASCVARVIGEAAKQRDMVIINTGSFWTDVHAESIRCCTHIALMMDQRATSIEACKQAIGLCSRLNVPQAAFLYLLNGCGRGAAFTPQDVCLALGGFEVIGIADGGLLVDELLSLGCPMELLESENAFVSSLESILDEILGSSGASSDRAPSVRSERTRIFDWKTVRRFLEGGNRRVAT